MKEVSLYISSLKYIAFAYAHTFLIKSFLINKKPFKRLLSGQSKFLSSTFWVSYERELETLEAEGGVD